MTKQQIRNELTRLEVKSFKYLDEYIDFCIENSNESNYQCVHHILPKSKNLPFEKYSNLKKSKFNAAYLSYSCHFKAHWLLVKAIKHKSISCAFVTMLNKDTKAGRISIDEIDIDLKSKEYEEIILEYNNIIKTISKNKVVCIDENGKTIRIDKLEYENNKNIYTTHSTKKLNVIDLTTGEKIRINVEDYDKNKHMFHLKNTATYIDIRDFSKISLKTNEKKDYHLHQNTKVLVKRNTNIIKISIKDILKNDILYSISCKEYDKNNKKCSKDKPEIIYYDLKNKKEIYESKIKKFDITRYIKISFKKSNLFTVICKKTFVTLYIEDINALNINEHINYCTFKHTYYIDIKNKKIIAVEKDKKIVDDNYVAYNKNNVKKYLNDKIDNYIKTEKYKSRNGYVMAYDINLNKNVRVLKETFYNTPNLVGIRNSKVKKLRSQCVI